MKSLFNIRKTRRSWEEVDYLTKTKWIRIQFFSENIFHIKSFIGSRLAPVCASCLWLTLADSWVALAGSGWFWVALSDSGVINRLVTPTFFKKRYCFHHDDYNFLFWHLCQIDTFNNNLSDEEMITSRLMSVMKFHSSWHRKQNVWR